jgi:hypothetical protein
VTDDELIPEDDRIDEFAVTDTEPMPLKWARYSRLIEPTGPFRASWLFDQVIQNKIRSVMLIPRDKLRGIRMINLESLHALLDQIAQAPGPARKHPEE